jgi:tight adherence protein B
MPLIILLVFLGVFAVLALVMTAVAGNSRQAGKVRATLASALKIPRFSAGEEVIDVRKDNMLSSIPWVHELLVQMHAAMELRRILDQADLNWTPARLLLTAIMGLLAGAYFLYAKADFGAASLLFGLPAGAPPFIYVWMKRRRRFNRFEQRLPDAIDLMVSALRAGHSTAGALGLVASDAPEPIRREFRLCFEEQNFGMDMRSAMENMLTRVPLLDLRIITTAILIHKESGGNLAEMLEKTAQVIRERFRLRDQIRVCTAQGRLSAWAMSLLPVGIGGVLSLLSPDAMRPLFTTPLGHKLLAFAMLMDITGLLVIRKLIRIRI